MTKDFTDIENTEKTPVWIICTKIADSISSDGGAKRIKDGTDTSWYKWCFGAFRAYHFEALLTDTS